ncbi:MAG TPA: hypothetical protein VIO94_01235, partial [Phenylobacterium sp.]
MRHLFLNGCLVALLLAGCSRSEQAATPAAETAPAAAEAAATPAEGRSAFMEDQTLDQSLERSRAMFQRMDQ